jgi:hypothetical protein
MTKIIAFAHRKRVGKDSAAKFLETALRVGRPGIKTAKLSFASRLKEVCYMMFGWAGLQPGIFYEDDKNASLREVVLPKVGMTPREIWIKVGNKMREIYADIWIDNALCGSPNADILIITDLRFTNEADKVHSLGGKVIKIIRPGIEVSDDASDCALDGYTGFDGTINNDGNLKAFHDKIVLLSEEIISALRGS